MIDGLLRATLGRLWCFGRWHGEWVRVRFAPHLGFCSVCTRCGRVWDELPRPTKSTALLTQMVGRGARPEPGVVDAFPGRDQAEADPGVTPDV